MEPMGQAERSAVHTHLSHFAARERRKRRGDGGGFEPVAIIDVDIGEGDDPVAVDQIGGREWQDPAVVAIAVRQSLAERCVDWAQLLGEIECDAIRLCGRRAGVAVHREREVVLFGGAQRLIRRLRRDRDERRSQRSEVGESLLQRAQLDIAVRHQPPR